MVRSDLNRRTIDLITREYRKTVAPWYIGFSGGKDSSALVKLVFLSLMQFADRARPITVVYCDTGVEIPIVSSLVRSTLRSLAREAEAFSLPLRIRIATPRLEDRYFVRVIGRGYPPPTNKFRWCTDRLRIAPVQRILRNEGSGGVVLLGVRRGESPERDRTIASNRIHGRRYFLRQSGGSGSLIFAPLIHYETEDVWATLASSALPCSIDARRLALMYRHAAGDCPIVREPQSTPCASGRFGCWTCTVIRRDHTVEMLVGEGNPELQPLLEFRNWLQRVRDRSEWRCPRRRNGRSGPGPFTLRARRAILTRLLAVQSESPWRLITNPERAAIEALWEADATSAAYRSIERP